MVTRPKRTDLFNHLSDSKDVRTCYTSLSRHWLHIFLFAIDPHIHAPSLPPDTIAFISLSTLANLHIPHCIAYHACIHFSPLSLSPLSPFHVVCLMLRFSFMGFMWVACAGARTLCSFFFLLSTLPLGLTGATLWKARAESSSLACCRYILCMVLFAITPDRASLIHIRTCLCAATTRLALSLYPLTDPSPTAHFFHLPFTASHLSHSY